MESKAGSFLWLIWQPDLWETCGEHLKADICQSGNLFCWKMSITSKSDCTAIKTLQKHIFSPILFLGAQWSLDIQSYLVRIGIWTLKHLNISWGSAFRGSKHLLTRYDWRMPAGCLGCRWLFSMFSAPHHTVWNWTRSDLITLMGRTGKPKQLEPCQQKALHNRSPNIAINFPCGRALCELLGLCEFFGCVLEGGAPSYWWSYGAPINGLINE